MRPSLCGRAGRHLHLPCPRRQCGRHELGSNPVTLTFPNGCSGAPSPPADFLAYAIGNVVHLVWDPPPAGVAATSYVVTVGGSFAGSFPSVLRSIRAPAPVGGVQLQRRRGERLRQQRRHGHANRVHAVGAPGFDDSMGRHVPFVAKPPPWPNPAGTLLQRLFSELLAAPASEREARLREIDHTDPALGAELEALLRRRRSTGQSARHAARCVDAGLCRPPAEGPFRAGMRVGAYELVRLVGEGGMGWVWLAERTDGAMKRTVALKLPKWTWTFPMSRRARARARHPRQSRARQHRAPLRRRRGRAGRPYLAMEYVEGQPIDVYCREHATHARRTAAACCCRWRTPSRTRTRGSWCIAT